ncbi:MAG: hypothetical protein K0R38_5630 [Polyangiaceae bacterium]|jgi:hypothetical protein|nr:hypothetical protein [Polyangiaceae bacterium]
MSKGVCWRAGQGFVALSLLLACSANSEPSSGNNNTGAGPGTGTSGSATIIGGLPGIAGGLVVDVGGSGGASGSGGAGPSCATVPVTAMVTRAPVDIIVAIDNSGSMQEEIDAVERNLNVNFANILEASGVDYRVIVISRHEEQGRKTSICVTAPLSANPSCEPPPDQPAFTERFYQYSLKVESLNSLVIVVDTFDGTEQDEYDLAPQGWGMWLRPNASKVFLEITDDNSAEMTAAEFTAAIVAKSPQFGTTATPNFRFHSIIGIGEKPNPTEPWLPDEPIQTSLCTGNNDIVENPGPVYQELSRATGGLRFPLCQFTAFDAVFDKIAKDVASHAVIDCEFPVPLPPMGKTLDLSTVAVSYTPDGVAPPKTYGQAMSLAQCVPDAFYVDAAANKILLCPDTCAAAQQGSAPKIDVLFTCEPTFVRPPE